MNYIQNNPEAEGHNNMSYVTFEESEEIRADVEFLVSTGQINSSDADVFFHGTNRYGCRCSEVNSWMGGRKYRIRFRFSWQISLISKFIYYEYTNTYIW